MASSNSVTDKLNKLSLGNRDRVNDSLYQTKRSKLHENRKDINEKINKEMRMRAGAKNLIELTKDKKMKSKINIEIDYFESNLKLWREELDKANSALDTYQNMKYGLPMIPIAMKNTVDIDFMNAFKKIISNHYGEDPEKYTDSINVLNLKRKKIQKPQRNSRGIDDHISYLNILNHIEKRFFFHDQSNGIIFSWNDIFTGVPFQQRTVIFEKSGVIFNLAALYSQLAAGKDKSTKSGLEEAQLYLLSAEASFSYLISNFLNAPSVDLKPEILKMLANLMKIQSMECKLLLLKKKKEEHEEMKTKSEKHDDQLDNLHCMELVSESYELSSIFDSVYSTLHLELLQYLEHIPQSWINLVQVKANYYRALAYQLLAYRYKELGYRDASTGRKLSLSKKEKKEPSIMKLSDEVRSILKPTKYKLQLACNGHEALGTAKLLLQEALQMIEEAIKLAAMNYYLRNLDDLSTFLQNQHKDWLDSLHALNASESYDLLTCPELSVQNHNRTSGDFTLTQLINRKPEVDPFRGIGPIETFNSRVKFGEVRCLMIIKDQVMGFGFSVKGNGPVRIVDVERGSNAEKAGLRVGDIVLSVGEEDMRWSTQETFVQAANIEGTVVRLSVVAIELNLSSSIISGPGNLNRFNTVTGADYNHLVSQSSIEESFSSNGHISLSSLPNNNYPHQKLTWKQRLTGTWKRNRKKGTLSNTPNNNSNNNNNNNNNTLTGQSNNKDTTLRNVNIAKSHSTFYQPPSISNNNNNNTTTTITTTASNKPPSVTLF